MESAQTSGLHPGDPAGAGADPLWDAPIVLAATPIGNLGDTTDRLRALLRTAEIIACEDTRRTRHLMSALGVSTTAKLVSLHEHNEASRAAELVEQAASGTRILVVSDAGMPAVSDPGFRLTAAAIEAGVSLTVAPGASAVTTALALSGLATDRFTFAGFVPRKQSERMKLLERLAGEEWTTVLFESPHRITATVSEFSQHLGAGRRAAVARELTKKYEEVLRGSLGELAEELTRRSSESTLRGEFVLVVGGAAPGDRSADGQPEQVSLVEVAAVVVERAQAGEKLKTVAKELAAAHGLRAGEVYNAAIQQRSQG
ncbi:16S rRNA (cytidine(1402)-2'-O)-methyltransferase [Nesterenkonia flava]|uniref:Ribosomal RNA small subunit methyltransferase I n=1 Tax=Nesterenkonia flava TaxID=469799 RepID=A0ABU1FQ30_9MICC|nr:16S rRNA (cytidine(1402)-2'-O)-methyltransferase [Nesterenkonia flava]MDR5710745.1 16S rRNA (cytidine(1402)-2'-O)-methyltransferase [Nesterenkonia flava]